MEARPIGTSCRTGCPAHPSQTGRDEAACCQVGVRASRFPSTLCVGLPGEAWRSPWSFRAGAAAPPEGGNANGGRKLRSPRCGPPVGGKAGRQAWGGHAVYPGVGTGISRGHLAVPVAVSSHLLLGGEPLRHTGKFDDLPSCSLRACRRTRPGGRAMSAPGGPGRRWGRRRPPGTAEEAARHAIAVQTCAGPQFWHWGHHRRTRQRRDRGGRYGKRASAALGGRLFGSAAFGRIASRSG